MAAEQKVQFALGSEVSASQHFFKSSFARSFVSSAKSLEPEPLQHDAAEFYSLVNFGPEPSEPTPRPRSNPSAEQSPSNTSTHDLDETEKLRKQCQALKLENERLRASLRDQPEHVQVIDNVYLQNQVDTLQWQLKQSEANRQMYRSLMEQVARFLERARKSLDVMHDKSLGGGGKSNRNSIISVGSVGSSVLAEKSRVPRSRSVHAVHEEEQPGRRAAGLSSCGSSTTSSASSTSSSSSSGIGRAKSVAHISPGPKDSAWPALRRNEPAARPKPPPPPSPAQLMSKSVLEMSNVVYRRPKPTEIDPNDVPPEKLSMEAFRLLRTMQSLLVMREPDLARLSLGPESSASPTPPEQDVSLSLQSNFANSTRLEEVPTRLTSNCSSSGTDDEANRTLYVASSNPSPTCRKPSLLQMNPGARQSIDSSSSSSKTTEDEDATLRPSGFSGQAKQQSCQPLQLPAYQQAPAPPSSTPQNRRPKRSDRRDLHLKSLRDWALGNSNGGVTPRPKPATSVSSAEDESGFSSMSSFQEVGLPNVASLSPIKAGCHTEIGLPEVPLDKVRHRRWSSTPAEFHALFKRHSGTFASNGQTTPESLSVWV